MTVKVMAEPTPRMPGPHTTALSVAAAAAVEEEERPKESMEDEIIHSAPKNLRHKASVLLRRLKQDDNIAWNAKGELVYKGDVVPILIFMI